MTLLTEGDKWRFHDPRVSKRAILITLATLISLALAGVLGWLVVVTLHNRPLPPSPAAAEPKPLTVLETAGINFLLAKETTGAQSISGTITDGGRNFGIRLSYLADGTAGSGTLTAGGMLGDVLIQNSSAFLHGDAAFWHALGVAGTPPPQPDWVVLPPDFLGSKVFVAPQSWTATLLPTAAARLNGNTYFSGHGDASATFSDKGIERFHSAGIDAEIRTITPAEVAAAVSQLGAEPGPGVPLSRTPKGDWAFPSVTVPAPDSENPGGPPALVPGAENTPAPPGAPASVLPTHSNIAPS